VLGAPLGTFVLVIVAVLCALAFAGLTAWWMPAAVLIAGSALDALSRSLNRKRRCVDCGLVYATTVEPHHGVRKCLDCRKREEREDRLDDLLDRATATVAQAVHQELKDLDDQELAELKIRLRTLGPDVAVAWRAYKRAARASNNALDAVGTDATPANRDAADAAIKQREQAKQVLVDSVRSATGRGVLPR
jgi:hypothetical protein